MSCSGDVWWGSSDVSWFMCVLLWCEGPGGVAVRELGGEIDNGELLPYNSSSNGGVGGRINLLSGGKVVSCAIGKFW